MKSNKLLHASCITLKKGKINKGNYNSTGNTMYQIASCSKFITSIVVARLYESGKLDYDTDITKYQNKVKVPKGITLRHLLSHTSGCLIIGPGSSQVLRNTNRITTNNKIRPRRNFIFCFALTFSAISA